MESRKPRVVFFQRKARSVGNYSVEFIFDDLRGRLNDKILAITHYSPYESKGLLRRLVNCITAFRQQGVVNHVTGDINYLGLFLSRERTIHTILDCVFVASSSGLKRTLLKYFWLTVPVRRSRFITAISTATKEEILRYVPCDPAKIVVIPVAISKRFVPQPRVFNKTKPLILQIGAAHNKNIPRLIQALANIPCTLRIIGKQSDEYEQLLKKYDVDYLYEWGLTKEEMINTYVNADIVTLLSTYEGFGMPILEAQATGRPVITSNILSMPEVAGNAACLVDPYDVSRMREGFLKIIHNDAYRDQLVRNGFDNIKRFDPEQIALEYFSLYQEIALD
jgi:glycosyltransferase involved in cell wall biosynthesis